MEYSIAFYTPNRIEVEMRFAPLSRNDLRILEQNPLQPCPQCGDTDLGCGLENAASYCVACQACGYMGRQIGVYEGWHGKPPLLVAIEAWNQSKCAN